MDQYRVFGNPIAQSRSPYIHKAFSESTQQYISYRSELVGLDDFESTVKNFIVAGGKGANVTVPFKEQALALCHKLSARAQLAGAVNTLIFAEGKIFGDNTDGLGLVQDLLSQQVLLKNCKILLLGAGGAAKGVILPLLDQHPKSITISNRTFSKAEDLCFQFNNEKLKACELKELTDKKYDLIINATSASLNGGMPPISEQLINENVICYDMVYGKDLTPFLLWAKKLGAKQVIDGLGMLVGQAAESFYLWRNVLPETEHVLTDLRASLAEDN